MNNLFSQNNCVIRRCSFFISLFSISFCLFLFGQNLYSQVGNRGQGGGDKPAGSIKGTVIDNETQKPILRATVTIHNAKDSSRVTGAYSDKSGNFNISVNPGNYYIRVNFVGYEPNYTKNVSISSDKLIFDASKIKLKISSVLTKEVNIIAEREAIEVGLDRKVFNIEQDAANLGGSALDVLANIPSITVDQDDNVSLRGNSDVKIMIDGRVSTLSASEALEQIPATMISSVELITNPGAKYEADGTAGMINIVTTKQREDGINAMVNLNGGADNALNGRFNGSLSANMSIGKWNFIANFSGRSGNRSGTSERYRTLWDQEGIPQYLTDDGESHNGNRFLSGKLGVEYLFTPSDILSYSFRLNKMKRFRNSEEDYAVFDELYNMIDFYERDQSNAPPFGTNSENALNYKHNFEQKGHELSFDFFYTTSSREGTTGYTQRNYILPDIINPTTSLQQNYSSNSNKNISTQVDYAVPIGTNLKIEAGAKYSSRISDIDNHLDDLIDDNWITDDNSSDQFDYDEQIAAGYITASSKIGKLFSYNIGVRSETTIIDFTSYRVPDSSFKDNYTLLFPSVYLSYEINAAHQFTANFSSRMRRPNYWNLNPRMNYDDPLNLSKGNPHLRPESHYQFEFGYLYNSDYTTFTTTLFHRYSVNGIEMYKEVVNGDTTLRMPHNISKSSRTGIDFIAMQKIFDWWKVDANLSIYNYVVDATNIGGESKTAFNWNTRLNSTMSFDKILDFTLTGGYRSKMLRSQGEAKANWNIDASLKYNFSKQLAFSFRIQDIFNTRQWNMYESIPGVLYNEMKNHFNSRGFFVGVTYKINNYKQKRENENEENNRMNSSEDIEFEQ